MIQLQCPYCFSVQQNVLGVPARDAAGAKAFAETPPFSAVFRYADWKCEAHDCAKPFGALVTLPEGATSMWTFDERRLPFAPLQEIA